MSACKRVILTTRILTVCSGNDDNAEQYKIKVGEWPCQKCTYKNQDKDIECQICGDAPWKEKILGRLVPVTQSQPSAQGTSQPGPTWTCNTCTLINNLAANECETCETPRPANEVRRSPNSPELVTGHPPPYAFSATHHAGSWNDIGLTIPGTMDQETQTEGLDACKPAQKVIGQIGRIYKLVKNRGSPKSSRDTSPLTRTSNDSPSPEDSANAFWPCSQCTVINSMDRTQCGNCGYEDDVPVAVFPPPEEQ